MKKFLYVIASIMVLSVSVTAQEKDKQKEFDKKFRFGLRVAGQPTWFTSNNNKITPSGAKFGFGFGLNMEFRLSEIVAFSTGIGGDLEGGSYKFTNDSANNYQVVYWQNSAGDFVELKGKEIADLSSSSNTGYLLDSRTLKTTYVTIPALLKLATKEYSGFKYFGMFGGEIGIRAKALANDTYYESYKFSSTGTLTKSGASTQENINIAKDASIPVRVGFNAGLGAEYRIGGSTSAFMSVNYFRAFTNAVRSESKFMASNVDVSGGSTAFTYVKQNLIMSAIRINLGILF